GGLSVFVDARRLVGRPGRTTAWPRGGADGVGHPGVFRALGEPGPDGGRAGRLGRVRSRPETVGPAQGDTDRSPSLDSLGTVVLEPDAPRGPAVPRVGPSDRPALDPGMGTAIAVGRSPFAGRKDFLAVHRSGIALVRRVDAGRLGLRRAGARGAGHGGV